MPEAREKAKTTEKVEPRAPTELAFVVECGKANGAEPYMAQLDSEHGTPVSKKVFDGGGAGRISFRGLKSRGFTKGKRYAVTIKEIVDPPPE